MAYTKTVWVDGSAPAISAANLNNIEQGVADSLRTDGTTTMTGQIVTVAGSATTPAIAPTGDSNNGIFFPASDQMAYSSSGTQRILFSGNFFKQFSETAVLGSVDVGIITQRSVNDSQLYISYRTTPDAWVIGATYATTGAYKPLTFATSDTERMRITSAGNVGIGTASPSLYAGRSSLGINGTDGGIVELMLGGTVKYQIYPESATVPNNIVQNASSSTGIFTWRINGAEKTRLDNSGYYLIGYTSSNGAYPLQVNGQIFATSSTIATSDARYKENVTPLTGALDLVNSLNPVQFDWKQHPVHKFNTEQPTVGFLAQEVAEVLKDQPYLNSVVKKSECTWETETGEFIEVTKQIEVDGELVDETVQEAVKETHTEEFYGIAESNLIAILTKAVQELSAKVTALEAQISLK